MFSSLFRKVSHCKRIWIALLYEKLKSFGDLFYLSRCLKFSCLFFCMISELESRNCTSWKWRHLTTPYYWSVSYRWFKHLLGVMTRSIQGKLDHLLELEGTWNYVILHLWIFQHLKHGDVLPLVFVRYQCPWKKDIASKVTSQLVNAIVIISQKSRE